MENETLSKGEQTRQQIIHHAHDLFLLQGFHGTSMRQIANAAGISLGGIYNHFNTKEAIFEAVFLAYHPYHHILPAVQAARGDTADALLRDIARCLTEELNADAGFLSLMFIDLVEFQTKHTTQLVEKLIPLVSDIFESVAQIAYPSLRPIPPLIVMRSFLGLFFSYYITGMFLKASSSLPAALHENAFDYFVDIYLHGVIDPDPPAKREMSHD